VNFGYGFVYPEQEIEAPFIDATGIIGEIDYTIHDYEMNAMKKFNFDAAIKFVRRLGLDLVKRDIPMEVVVIRIKYINAEKFSE